MKALLIESDKDMQYVNEAILNQIGYEVDVATDGEVGLQKMIEQRYDLVIMRVMLPAINGIEVLEKLKTSSKNQGKILVVTNLTRMDMAEQAISLGADGYIALSDLNRELLEQYTAGDISRAESLARIKELDTSKSMSIQQRREEKPPRPKQELDFVIIYIVGALIVGVITFIVTWIYAILSWGLLFGLMLGWIPATIAALIIGATWPILAVPIIIMLIVVVIAIIIGAIT